MKIESIAIKLVKLITEKREGRSRPFIVGLSGGQGSGKTTLCQKLEELLINKKLSCCVLSLDDFYLSKAKRRELADRTHPLAFTRGVPGTHDVNLLKEVLTNLSEKSPSNKIKIPIFSKLSDDLISKKKWRICPPHPQIILMEGWCIGAKPSFLSKDPLTSWEKTNDPDGLWKSWTIIESVKYQSVWDTLDFMIFIKQDNFEHIVNNRWNQEIKNLENSGATHSVSQKDIREFCYHFESWTHALWKHLPTLANITITCAPNYNYRWPKNEAIFLEDSI